MRSHTISLLAAAGAVVPVLCARGAPAPGDPAVPGPSRPSVVALVAGRPAPGADPVGGELREPFAVEADGAGNLYIAELKGGRILKLDDAGRLATIAGTGEKGYGGDGGPAIRAQFNGMHHLALTVGGGILVADTWNCRIRKIEPDSGHISTIAGTGVKGFSGDGGPATAADCGGIYCLAPDPPRNRLAFADLDNRRVRILNFEDDKVSTLAGNGQRGVPTDGALAGRSPLVDPRAVACDAAGNVYILERGGHALRVVDRDGRIRTVAGTGAKGPGADDAPAREATFNGPKHLCVDPAGDVVIADAENHMIRKLIVARGRVVRVAGSGRKGTAGIGGDPLRVELDRPHGVFVDGRGTLYIADSGNDRILKIAAP